VSAAKGYDQQVAASEARQLWSLAMELLEATDDAERTATLADAIARQAAELRALAGGAPGILLELESRLGPNPPAATDNERTHP
jgi:hypothetical protein